MANKLVAEDLFEIVEDAAVLMGGKCGECGAVAFPRPSGCADCTSADIEAYRLETEGTLWTFTVQAFRPKEPYDGPEEFTPFGVGYVNLGDEVLVEGWLTENDPERLQIGMPMRAVPKPYTTDSEGSTVVTFAFAPTGD